jgi:hypothetical protein
LARWWRIFVFLPFFMSIMALTAAHKGLCVLLHHNGNMRGVRPWEVVPNTKKPKDDEEGITAENEDMRSEYASDYGSHGETNKWMSTFGTRNDFSDEQWITRWKNRPWIQRFFEPTTKVREEGIRIMQDTIVKQSQIWALFGATVLTIAITSLPKGKIFR